MNLKLSLMTPTPRSKGSDREKNGEREMEQNGEKNGEKRREEWNGTEKNGEKNGPKRRREQIHWTRATVPDRGCVAVGEVDDIAASTHFDREAFALGTGMGKP